MDQFDPDIPGLMQGNITSVTVIDPALVFPGFEVGNRVIDPTRPFDVNVTWELTGLIAPLWLHALGGNWDVSVYAESLGGGNEVRLGTNNTVPAVFNQRTYSAAVTVPANTLQRHAPGTDQSGIYKFVVAVFLNSDLGPPGFDIIGFSEGPIVQLAR